MLDLRYRSQDERSIERDYFTLALAQDMAILPWSPLAGGLLTGKFDRDSETGAEADARLRNSPRGAQTLKEENLDVAEAVSAMARGIGCTTAQLALAWMLRRSDACVIPVIGARNVGQLEDNIGAVDVQLEPAQIAALDEMTQLAPEYPHTLYASEFFQAMMYGEVRPRIDLGSPW